MIPHTTRINMLFNPRGFLPGQGARTIEVEVTPTASGGFELANARVEKGSTTYFSGARVWQFSTELGDRQKFPGFVGAADAIAGAVGPLLSSLDTNPSDPPGSRPDFGYRSGRLQLWDEDGHTFYGSIGDNSRPAIRQLSEHLMSLASHMQKELPSFKEQPG